MIMKAMANVLQDDDFIIKNSDINLGLLSATKEVDIEKGSKAFCANFWDGATAKWDKSQAIEASANISNRGESSRVRINFQRKTVNNQ